MPQYWRSWKAHEPDLIAAAEHIGTTPKRFGPRPAWSWKHERTAPLLISDCDEVLLHMVVPFRDWLDEAHHIHFDLVHGDWGEALRHKHDGTQVERGTCLEPAERLFS